MALEEWVTNGKAPPASRVPLLDTRPKHGSNPVRADGARAAKSDRGAALPPPTAVEAASLKLPDGEGICAGAGLQSDRRAGRLDRSGDDRRAGRSYRALVSEVDADGNEVAGIRLPDIAVPLATYTGWNVYRAEPSELCDRDGSYIPFARTKAEREAADDPRPSLEERYGNRAAYVAQVKAVAGALVADRLLLPADARRVRDGGGESDRF